LTIARDGKQKAVEATISEMPQNVASAERKAAQHRSGKPANALGMELLPLDSQPRKELKVPKDLNGWWSAKSRAVARAGDLGYPVA
jgi:hypothetical protein